MRRDRRESSYPRRKVLIPVDERMEKFVESREYRRHYKCDMKKLVCLSRRRSGDDIDLTGEAM